MGRRARRFRRTRSGPPSWTVCSPRYHRLIYIVARFKCQGELRQSWLGAAVIQEFIATNSLLCDQRRYMAALAKDSPDFLGKTFGLWDPWVVWASTFGDLAMR